MILIVFILHGEYSGERSSKRVTANLFKDDNCIIIKNKQVYKSELDYLYDDNENNVDKANNENNETEIIETEEVDTGKIDWDW